MLFHSAFIAILSQRITTSTQPTYDSSTVTINSNDDFADSNLISEMTAKSINKIIIADGVTEFPTSSAIQIVPTIVFQSPQITSIPDFAFYHNRIIHSVELSNYITEIGKAAFFSSSISQINFNHVENIQDYAFFECDNLKTIDVNKPILHSFSFAFSGVESVSNLHKSDSNAFGTFIGCKNLVSLTINNNNIIEIDGEEEEIDIEIPTHAFYLCTSLSQVTFTSDVGTIIISSSAFECTSISQIDFSKTTYVDHYAFASCKFTTISGLKAETEFLTGVFQNNYDLTTVDFGAILGYINYEFFMNCLNLRSFSSTTIDLIQRDFFLNCISLESVNLPNCASIGESAFAHCISLESVTVKSTGEIEVGSNAFVRCKKLASFPIDRIQQNNVNFGGNQFYGCENLASSEFTPLSGSIIGDCMYYMCPKIIALNLNNVELHEFSFAHCTGLTRVTLDSSITTIPKGCFYACSKLTTINLENVNNINEYAFGNTTSLSEVILGESTIEDRAFQFSGLITVTLTKTVQHKVERFWTEPQYSVPFPDFENIFPPFIGCSNLKTVKYGPEVESFPPALFFGQKNIQVIPIQHDNNRITNDNGVLISPNNTMIYYSSTKPDKSFTLPERVGWIGDFALIHANNLETLTINKFIDTSSFMCACCNNLKSVIYDFVPPARDPSESTFYATKYYIKYYAFYKCSNLANVQFPENILYVLKQSVFQYCTSIQYYDFTGCYVAENYCFSHCSGLKSIKINSDFIARGSVFQYSGLTETDCYVATCGGAVFNHCKDLKKVNFMKTDRYLQLTDQMFAYSSVENLTGLEHISKLGFECFAYTKLKYFELPPQIHEIEPTAFRGIKDFRYIVCHHDRFFATDHELIEIPSYTLVATFGDLPSTYIVPSFVQKIGNNAIISNPIIDESTGKVINFGVTTIITQGDTHFESNSFNMCPYLYNLCYGGHYQEKEIGIGSTRRIFVADYFQSNYWFTSSGNIKVIKGKCETSVPYKDYAKGNFNAEPSGIQAVYKPRDIFPLTECNEKVKLLIKYDEPSTASTTTKIEPEISSISMSKSNEISSSKSEYINGDFVDSKKLSILTIVLIALASIEIIIISALIMLLIVKKWDEDTDESSVVQMREEAVSILPPTFEGLTTENALFTMNAVEDDPFVHDFDDEDQNPIDDMLPNLDIEEIVE